MNKLALALAMTVVLAGCGGSDSSNAPYETLAFSGWFPEGSYVFHSQDELTAALDDAWARTPGIIYSGSQPPSAPPPFPAVDFGHKWVAVISLDVGTACQHVVVTGLRHSGSDLIADYKVDPPYATSNCSLTHVPWNVFLTIPHFDGRFITVRQYAPPP
jgi:hypothetical protein